MRAVLAVLLSASLSACDGPASEQRAVLEAVAAAERDVRCLHPMLRADRWYDVAAVVPPTFNDLVDRPAEDWRLTGNSFGSKTISEDPDCSTVSVPRVAGDRALVVLDYGRSNPGISGLGLRRWRGIWTIVERRRTGASHPPGESD